MDLQPTGNTDLTQTPPLIPPPPMTISRRMFRRLGQLPGMVSVAACNCTAATALYCFYCTYEFFFCRSRTLVVHHLWCMRYVLETAVTLCGCGSAAKTSRDRVAYANAVC
jgi:hypothetical protein